jgi:hypothetical protein
MNITVNRINDSITGSFNGKAFGVSFSEDRYNQMKALEKQANEAGTMAELKDILDAFEPLTHEDYKSVVESKSPYLSVNSVTNQFFLKYNQQISKEPLPQAFVDRILEATEKGLDVKPLVKCWARFMRNPNYSTQKAALFAFYINQKFTDPVRLQAFRKEGVADDRAVDMATTYQTPITKEGLICTYKVSKEITEKFVKDESVEGGVKKVGKYDYEVDEETGLKTYANKDMEVEDRVFEPAVQGTSGDEFIRQTSAGVEVGRGHKIKVGDVHLLADWKMVDCRDNVSCVKGLHVGNLDYIRGYQQKDTVTHYVFVDPMHVGAIVQDNTGALRVKQYMVYKSYAGVNRSLYHSSEYSKLTDAEYDKLVQEAVTATQTAAQEFADAKLALKGDGGLGDD